MGLVTSHQEILPKNMFFANLAAFIKSWLPLNNWYV